MAHSVIGDGPYPALYAAAAEINHPHLVLVRDPGGLYIVEDVAQDAEMLLTTTTLLVQWAVDEMREQHGGDAAEHLLRCLAQGLGLNASPGPALAHWDQYGAGRPLPESDDGDRRPG